MYISVISVFQLAASIFGFACQFFTSPIDSLKQPLWFDDTGWKIGTRAIARTLCTRNQSNRLYVLHGPRFFLLLPSIAANVCFGMLIVSHLTLFGLVSGNINHNKIGISQEKKRPTNERKNVPMSQTVIDIPQRRHFDSLSWISDTILHFCLVPREFSSEFQSHPFYHSQPILVFINSNPVWQHIKCDILVVKSVCLFHSLTASLHGATEFAFPFSCDEEKLKAGRIFQTRYIDTLK